jgi:hypothetical protein
MMRIDAHSLTHSLTDSLAHTSNHLNTDTKTLSFGDGIGGIMTRRVEQRNHSLAHPIILAIGFGDSNTKRTVTTITKILDDSVGFIGNFLIFRDFNNLSNETTTTTTTTTTKVR